MRRWIWAAFAVTFLAASADYGRAAECDLSMFPVKLVENNVGAILLSVQLGDKPAIFMLDTGAVWSVIRQRDVGDLPLLHAPVTAYGAGGTKFDNYVRIPSFKIGPGDLPNVDFMVVPDAMAADDRIDGVLGANFLHNFDLEIDLTNNVVNFFKPSGCGERVVYWPHQGVAAVPIEKEDDRHLHVMMTLDDKPVRALIDTGASGTILTLAAADELFGLHTESPGVEAAASAAKTADGKDLPLFRRRFRALTLGGVQFLNPWLSLAEDRVWQHEKFGSKPDQLILGTHQLRQLHLYIAYKDRMLYATAPGSSAAPHEAPQTVGIKALDPLDAELIQAAMKGANGHLLDNRPDLAVQELDQIIQRYPTVAGLYYDRATILAKTGGNEAALADLDRAVALDPKLVDAHHLRGDILHLLHRETEAKAELLAAQKLQADIADKSGK